MKNLSLATWCHLRQNEKDYTVGILQYNWPSLHMRLRMLIGSWEPWSGKNFPILGNLLPEVIPEPTVKRSQAFTANASRLRAVCTFQPWSQRSTQHNSTLQLSWVESGAVITAFVTRPGHLSSEVASTAVGQCCRSPSVTDCNAEQSCFYVWIPACE